MSFPGFAISANNHGCRFQAIDLRWGAREEAALDQLLALGPVRIAKAREHIRVPRTPR